MKKKNIKKVSIIIPVYKVEKYISKCLDNLINQTLDDIEIILVNDGSPDNSQKIIDKYVKKYPDKIKSFIKENGGPASARNFGIKKASGEYLGFVDSDDWVDLDLFEKLYNKANETKSDIVVCPIKYVYTDKTTQNIYDEELFHKSIVESPKLLEVVKSFTWNKLFKREIWIDNKFEFPHQYFEDNAIMYNILLMANRIECIHDSYYYYNKQNETAITRIIEDRRAYDNFKSCDSILKFYKEKKKYEGKVKEYVDGVIIGHIRFRIRTYIKCNSVKELKEYVDYSINYLDKNIPGWRHNHNAKLSLKNKFNNNIYALIFKNKFALNMFIFINNIRHKIKK